MNMSVPVSPIVLKVFYVLLLKETIFFILVAALLWFSLRNVVWVRRTASSWNLMGTEQVSPMTAVRKVQKWLTFGLGGLWVLDGLLQAQPAMSNQFIPDLVDPLISQLPGVLPHLLEPPLYIWTLHPLFFDSLAVWVQVFLGVAVMLGAKHRIGRIGLYVSLGWTILIWVFGEAFGSLLNGATWLTGAPGSVLLYGLIALALLQPTSDWNKGRVLRWLTTSIGVLWLLFAILQSWPAAGFWEPGGLKGALLPMAQMNQPAWLAYPINFMANFLDRAPAIWNGTFVLILSALAVGWLWGPRQRGLVEFSIIFTFLTWWLGQDFGVIGGMGTDPNTGAPLLLLLLSIRPLLYADSSVQTQPNHSRQPRKSVWPPVWITLGSTTLTIIGAIFVGNAAETHVAAAEIQPALSNAGLTPVNLPEPSLTLTNQNGKSVSLSSFRGKAVLLTFLDPVCYSDCPIISAEMKQADKLLGKYSSQVQMVAIDANPVFHSVQDVRRFDQQEGLDQLPNWTYLTSPNLQTLKQVWGSFGEYVSVPRLGMVVHADNLYFISPSGREIWLASGSDQLKLGGSYSSLMATYLQKLLNVSHTVIGENQPQVPRYMPGISHPQGVNSLHMMAHQAGWELRTVGPYEEVLRTSDGGRHWANVTPTGISTRGGLLIDALSTTQAVVMVPPFGYDEHASLFKTVDGGKKWSPVGRPLSIPGLHGQNDFYVSSPGHFWLTGSFRNSGLYMSSDYGIKWNIVHLPLQVTGTQRLVTGPMDWTSSTVGRVRVEIVQTRKSSTTWFRTNNGGQTWHSVGSSGIKYEPHV